MTNCCNHCSETYSMPALLQPFHKEGSAVHQYCRACFGEIADLIIRSKDNVLLVQCKPCGKYVRVESANKDRIVGLFERNIRLAKQTAAEIEGLSISTPLQLSQ